MKHGWKEREKEGWEGAILPATPPTKRLLFCLGIVLPCITIFCVFLFPSSDAYLITLITKKRSAKLDIKM
jgi:hypothetical protein